MIDLDPVLVNLIQNLGNDKVREQRRQPFQRAALRRAPHPSLQPLPLSEGEGVRLGDDRNHVHLVVNGLHELDVQRFQAADGKQTNSQEVRGRRVGGAACVWTDPWPRGEMK